MQLQHFPTGSEHVGLGDAGGGSGSGTQCLARALAHQPQDLELGIGLRIVHPHMHQEAVQLRLWQRVGAFLLDRILGGHHQEQCRQWPSLPAHRHLPLTHRLQQRRLHLGRRAIDFVGQQQGMENRPGLEFEAPVLRPPDLGAGQIGRQQVGGELHAGKIGLETRGQRPDGGGLGQSRRAFHQQVAIGQQGDQQALDKSTLAHDFPREVFTQSVKDIMQAGIAGCGCFHVQNSG